MSVAQQHNMHVSNATPFMQSQRCPVARCNSLQHEKAGLREAAVHKHFSNWGVCSVLFKSLPLQAAKIQAFSMHPIGTVK